MVDIVSIGDDEKDRVSLEIEENLLSILAQTSEQSKNESLVLTVRNGKDRLIGGVTGRTSYGWLLIKTLWVDEAHRRTGLGSRLMSEAEDRGRGLGCHAAWLDTSNREAFAFYATLGYEVFGEISNDEGQQPPGHKRWFMQKAL